MEVVCIAAQKDTPVAVRVPADLRLVGFLSATKVLLTSDPQLTYSQLLAAALGEITPGVIALGYYSFTNQLSFPVVSPIYVQNDNATPDPVVLYFA